MPALNESFAFSRNIYYAMIAVSAINPDRCGICVDTVKPTTCILSRAGDVENYIVYRTYTFNAPKKSAYASIICNLRSCGIEPISGFIPNQNPDNKYYLDLPIGFFNDIIQIIEKTLNGLCLGLNAQPEWAMEITSDEDIVHATKIIEKNIIHLDNTLVVVIQVGPKKSYQLHKFPTLPTTPTENYCT
jgi:hypothetical protein